MKQKDWLLIAIAVLIGQLLYWPTRLAGFVTDFTGLAERIETHGVSGIPSSFGFPALQPVSSIFYFLLYHGAGPNSWGWHLAATLLHTINALLLFFLLRRLLQERNERSAWFLPGIGALLFLLSPYASEVVVWRVGFHYLLVTCFTLLTLRSALNWLEAPKVAHWWPVLLWQLVGLLTYELAIMTPFLVLILGLWYCSKSGQRAVLTQLFAPLLSLVGLYFIGNKLLLGSWIGHYGSSVHLHFPIMDMLGNIGRYFFKWVAFTRYWPHPWKAGLANTLTQPWSVVALVTLLAVLAYWLIRTFRRSKRQIQLFWAFSAMGVVALVPVLNLYFNYLLHIENDRYGYLAALFFYPAWVALLSRLPKIIFLSASGLYVLLSVGFLWQTNQYWAQSTTVYRGLLADFDAYGQDSCYLLNLPDNLQGAPIFRDYSGQDRAFADALQYVRGRPYEGVLQEVIQYNMVASEDGVQVEKDSSDLKVTFNQWGNWWWRRGIGAASYRDTTYIFHNEGHHYRLEWRRSPRGVPILFQQGTQWLYWEE